MLLNLQWKSNYPPHTQLGWSGLLSSTPIPNSQTATLQTLRNSPIIQFLIFENDGRRALAAWQLYM